MHFSLHARLPLFYFRWLVVIVTTIFSASAICMALYTVLVVGNVFMLRGDIACGMLVASIACVRVCVARVTGGACHCAVFTMVKWEGVAKGGGLPGCGSVAGCTASPILSAVVIVLGMAGVAILGCASKDVVDMTLGACGVDVFAGQREGGQVVIKGGRLPCGGGVAG